MFHIMVWCINIIIYYIISYHHMTSNQIKSNQNQNQNQNQNHITSYIILYYTYTVNYTHVQRFRICCHMYVCMYRFQNVVLRCPILRLHCFLSYHWPSCRFLSFMAFLISSTQFLFGVPRALFCFGIHFNAILCNLPSAIL